MVHTVAAAQASGPAMATISQRHLTRAAVCDACRTAGSWHANGSFYKRRWSGRSIPYYAVLKMVDSWRSKPVIAPEIYALAAVQGFGSAACNLPFVHLNFGRLPTVLANTGGQNAREEGHGW